MGHSKGADEKLQKMGNGMNFLIYGANGYIGSALVNECIKRDVLWRHGNRSRIEEEVSMLSDGWGIINAAAFIPMPTVDACKNNLDETISGNVVLPSQLAIICKNRNIPLMQLSTACIFDEQREYFEEDEPTRGWAGYCGFYVGTKLLAEKLVREWEKHYILRLRLPFDEFDSPRNYLSKLAKFGQVFEHLNSLTHRGDFAKWALDLWEKKAAWGTYNCVNQGQVSAYDLVMLMSLYGMVPKLPEFVKSSGTTGARLSVDKLLNAGVDVQPVTHAVMQSLKNWTTT